jgi:hypothetical protein
LINDCSDALTPCQLCKGALPRRIRLSGENVSIEARYGPFVLTPFPGFRSKEPFGMFARLRNFADHVAHRHPVTLELIHPVAARRLGLPLEHMSIELIHDSLRVGRARLLGRRHERCKRQSEKYH